MIDKENNFIVTDREKRLRKLDHLERTLRSFQLVVLTLVVMITLLSLLRVGQLATDNQKNITEHRDQIESNSAAAQKQLQEAGTGNRARAEVGLCIFSVSPTRRTPDYVKGCYDLIDKKYSVKVPRFGDGIE